MIRHIAPLAALLAALGCGADKKDDEKESTGDAPQTAPSGAADAAKAEYEEAEVVGQNVGAQLEESAAMALEDQDAGDAFGLTEVEKTKSVTRSRACVEDGDKAVVTIKAHRLFERELSGPIRAVTAKREGYREVVRTWSRTGGAVKCADNKKHAALTKGEDFTGVSLAAVGKRYREESGSFEHKQKDYSLARSRKANVEFDRKVTWDKVEKTGETYQIAKTVVASGTRKLEVSVTGTKNGKTKNVAKSFTSAFKADGLKVTVARAATGAFLSRTLSGVIAAENTHADGKVVLVTTTLADAKYEAGKLVSGKVTTTFTVKGESEPFKTAEGSIADGTLVLSVKTTGGDSDDVEVPATADVDGDDAESAATESEQVTKPAGAT